MAEVTQNVPDSPEAISYSLESGVSIVYPEVDATLTTTGKAADAKVVGDYFRGMLTLKSNGNIEIKTFE